MYSRIEEKKSKKKNNKKSIAKSNSGKLGWFQSFNPDAGNVPFNISMFNQGFGMSMGEDLEDPQDKIYSLLNNIDRVYDNRYDLLNYFLSIEFQPEELNDLYNFIVGEEENPEAIYNKLEEYELNNKIITEGFEDIIKKAELTPDGRKILSETEWDALWDKNFSKYEDKKYMSLEEYKEYSKLTRMFGRKYVCSSIN